MHKFQYQFAVIGGDLRMTYTARFLAEQGMSVISYGLAKDVKHCDQAASLEQAVTAAATIIGPVPLSKQKDRIEHQSDLADMTITELVNSLSSGQNLFAGCLSEALRHQLTEKQVFFYDFMKDDATAIYNGIATAEGIIAEAIKTSPSNLHNSEILILGFGRCAKTLADRLKGLSLHVTVCARSEEQIAAAAALGFRVITFRELISSVDQYDLVFNSVPHLVVSAAVLEQMNQETMIFDIASNPGGVDFEYAEKKGIFAKLYPGLPGKYAPKTSGEILADCVLRKLIN